MKIIIDNEKADEAAISKIIFGKLLTAATTKLENKDAINSRNLNIIM